MTGQLTIKRSDASFILGASDTYYISTASNNGMTVQKDIGGLLLRDKNNVNVGYIRAYMQTNGNNTLELLSQNMTTAGTTVTNAIQINALKNGSKTYYVSDATNFRSAIGLNAAIITRAFDTGTFTLAAGGSVVKEVTVTVSGYAPIALREMKSNHQNTLKVDHFYLTTNKLGINVYNSNNSSQSCQITGYIIYAKNELWG